VFFNANESIASLEGSFEGVYIRRSSFQFENLSALLPGLGAATTAEVTQYAVAAGVAKSLASWCVALTGDLSADITTSPQWLTSFGLPYKPEGDIYKNNYRSLGLTANGPVFSEPAGAVQLAFGAGYSWETFGFKALPSDASLIAQSRLGRYGYAETHIPVLGSAAETDEAETYSSDEIPVPHPPVLMLSLAGRTEHYGDLGSTSNPKVGLIFTPIPDVTLRASWSKSFRPPSLVEKFNTEQANLESVPNPAVPGDMEVVLLRFGGNPHLVPERAKTLSAGLDLKPHWWPGSSFNLTGYTIDYRSRIQFPTASTGNPLADSAVPPFTIYGPSAAQLAQVKANSQFTNLTGAAYDAATVAALVDDRYQNVSRQLASGVDFLSGYALETAWGNWNLALDIAYLNLRQQITADAPVVPLSGTVFYPPRYRGRAGIAWDRHGVALSTFLNYNGSTHDVDSTPPQAISSWTTINSQLAYTTQEQGMWGSIRIAIAVQNLFDRRPPFVDAAQAGPIPLHFDSTNASALGRFFTLQVSKSW
jgi:outer membrane receptor protein involved in Fe transport